MAIGAAAGALALARLASGGAAGPASVPPGLSDACATDNPYVVTVCHQQSGMVRELADAKAAVVAFRDTPADYPSYLLATMGQVGSVYGLAYDGAGDALYAAAFHRRQLLFGPGGPGAIYRMDLATGDVRHWATVPDAGQDNHDHRVGHPDVGAERGAGKNSLGDLDLDPATRQLFVTNLATRRIVRLDLATGQVLGDFAHGAIGETWAADARPFGLAVRDGRVYHGLVHSAESTARRGDLAAYVYSSEPDGSDMRQVTTFRLDYGRGYLDWKYTADERLIPLDWRPWRLYPPRQTELLQFVRSYPMPELADIEFAADGDMVVGLRDRMADMAGLAQQAVQDPFAFGAGDILHGRLEGQGWVFEPGTEHYRDATEWSAQTSVGSLAALRALDQVLSGGVFQGWDTGRRVSASSDLFRFEDSASVTWYDTSSGKAMRGETVCASAGDKQPVAWLPRASVALADNESPPGGTMGDLELLCGVPFTPATPVPSATATTSPVVTTTPTASATASRTASPTPTPMPSRTRTVRPSPTLTPRPLPLYLPLALHERCDPQHKRADVALVIDTSSSMAGRKLEDAKAAAAAFVGQMDLAPGRDQVAVVRYDTEAEVACRLTNARAVIEAAIRNLTSRSGTHIDKGLRMALAELQSARRLDRNLPVMVLLTDGIQTGTPGEELRAAVEVRGAGVRLFTIGLGADVDAATLREMAGDDSRHHYAPDSADLARIYAEIASDVLCPAPAGGFWPGE